MGAGDVRAGRAYVEIGGDDKQLSAALARARVKLGAMLSVVRDMGAAAMRGGAAVVAPMLLMARSWATSGSDLLAMSQRTGFAVESLSELAYAAKVSNVDMETFEKSVRKMQQTLVDAGTGSQGAVDTLARLGLTLAEMKGLSPEAQFGRVADALAKIKDPAIRAALATDVLGRSGTQLLPMLTDGAAGLQLLQARARELGLTMRTASVEAADEFDAKLDAAWMVVKRGANAIGEALVPALSQAVTSLTAVAVRANAWIRENQQLVATVFKVAVGVTLAGAAIVAVGKALGLASAAVAGLGAVWSLVAAGIGVAKAAMLTILTPLGLVAAAAVGVGAVILQATGAGGAALRWLGDRFRDLGQWAAEVFQGIRDAIAAGDIALAGQILWMALKVVWTAGVSGLSQIWAGFKAWFLGSFVDLYDAARAAAEYIWAGIQIAWIEGAAAVKRVWAELVSWHQRAQEAVTDFIANGMAPTGKDAADARANQQYLDDQRNMAMRSIDQEKKARIDAINATREAGRAAAGERLDRRLATIGQQNLDVNKQIQAEKDAEIAKYKAELENLQAQLRGLTGKAREKRQQAEAAPAPAANPEDWLKKAQAKLAGAGDWDSLVRQKTAPRGIFNVAALQSLEMQGPIDRVAKATEQTARNTKDLVNEARNGGAKFQ